MDTQWKDYPVSIMEEADSKKTKRKVRRFTPDFKASAVRLVLDEGRSIDAVVNDLGLTRSSFCLWLRQARIDRGNGKGEALTTSERARLKELEKENRVLKVERELLKKWAAFFAKETSK
jgi:transposase